MKRSKIIAIVLTIAISMPSITIAEDRLVTGTIPVKKVEIKNIKNLDDGFKKYNIPLDEDVQRYIFKQCKEYDVPYELALSVSYIETGGTFEPTLRSASRDTGLFQINDVHKEWLYNAGVTDLYNPYQNSLGGIWILSDALKRGNDIHSSMMIYNHGYAGAKRQWNNGIYSTKYSKLVVQTMKTVFN